MTTAATISARLTLDKSDYDKGLGDADKQASSFQSKMKSVGQSMSRVGAGMTAALTVPVVGAFTAMVTSASDLNESANAMTVVFGEASGSVKAFGEQSAETVGLAKSDWFQLAAVQGAALKNYGFNQEQAGQETIKLATRAADMASIFNTDVNDAMTAIGALMRGETEPIKRYGVSMSQAAIEAKAMSMGLIKADVDMVKVSGAQLKLTKAVQAYNAAVKEYGEDSDEATEANQKMLEADQDLSSAMAGSLTQMNASQKAQASLALFYEQTDQFAGDFANTSDQLANSSRILKAQLKDEAAALGADLLPYVLKAVTYFRELIGKFQQLTPEQKKWIMVIMGVVAVLGPLLMILGSVVTAISAIIPVITAVAGLFTFPLIAVIAAVIAIIALLYAAWQNNWGGIREFTASVIQWISDFIDETMQFITDLTTGQLGEWSAIWDRSTAAIKQIVDLLFANLKLLMAAFKAAFSGDWRKLGEIIRQMLDNAGKAWVIAIKTAWANIKSFFSGAVSSLKSWFMSINWSDVGTNLIRSIATGLTGALPLLLAAGRSVFSALGEFLSGFFGGGGGSVPGAALPTWGSNRPDEATGTNGWQTVPPGFNDDSYMVGMKSGEEYAVKTKNDSGSFSGTGTVNYFNPLITVITGKNDPKQAIRGFI